MGNKFFESEDELFAQRTNEAPLTFSPEGEVHGQEENDAVPQVDTEKVEKNEKKTSVTVVTMFFNLKNFKDSSPSTRPMEFYVKNGREVIKLRYPMVIFCDEVTYPPLKEMRDQEVDPEQYPTKYIIKNLSEYEYYQNCWHIIDANRKKRGYPSDSRNTVSYLLMGMFKPLALSIVDNMNFFKSTHYAWIDLGCNHIVRNLAENYKVMLENPQPKVRPCYIHYRSKEELSDMVRFMEQQGPCGIATTAFTVEAEYVDRLYTGMFSIFYEKLYRGVGHTDETVMTFCYDRFPDMFNIYYGDYYSIFSNYWLPKEDIDSIINFFIRNAMNAGRWDLAREAAAKILGAVRELREDQLNFIKQVLGLYTDEDLSL